MDSLQYTRMEDLPINPVPLDPKGVTDLSPFLGTWINTNPAARGIVNVILSEHNGAFMVRVFGASEPMPSDWGEVKGTVYADAVNAHQATSFTAVYDCGFMEVHLQTYLAKGVLVIATFTRFKDGSGRSNYFTKEFFYRQ